VRKALSPLLLLLSLGINLIAVTRKTPTSAALSGLEASPFFFRLMGWMGVAVTVFLALAIYRSRLIPLPKTLPKSADGDFHFYAGLLMALLADISSASLLFAVLRLSSGQALTRWQVAVTLVLMLGLLALGLFLTRRLVKKHGAVEPELTPEEEDRMIREFMEEQKKHQEKK